MATNEDSWSEATFARPGLPRPWGRLQQQQNGAEADRGPQSPVTEGDDDVFLDDPDRRGPGHVGLYVDGLDSRDPVSPKSGRSTPETLRSCAISWVADDVDTVHTLSDHNQGPTYDYTDTGVVSAATTIDVLCYLWGIGSYLWDVGSDLALAYKYYSMGHIVWFSLTLFFVLAPALCMTTFSLTLYIRDHVICGEKASAHRWVPRTFFLILQLAPLWRYIRTSSSSFTISLMINIFNEN